MLNLKREYSIAERETDLIAERLHLLSLRPHGQYSFTLGDVILGLKEVLARLENVGADLSMAYDDSKNIAETH